MNYYFEELKYLGERLGLDRPEVAACMEKAVRNPGNIPVYKRHFLRLLKNEGFTLSDLPLFSSNLPENIDEEGIFVGNVILGNGSTRKLFLSVDSFKRHVLVCGMTGAGKSTLVKSLIPRFAKKGIYPWIFDNEDEYKILLGMLDPNDIYIFDIHTDRDNFLEPPPGVSPQEWLALLKNLFREVFYLRDGSINLLDMILRKLYRERGVLDGSENYPYVADVTNLLDVIEFKPGTRFSGYHESLVNRFGGLKEDTGEILKCRRGYPLPDLNKKCVIYRTGGLSDDKRNFYIYLKMMRELAYKERLPQSGLRTIFVIDEAHKLYNREVARRNDLGEPIVFSNARTFAKKGIGCIYIDQVPSELPPALFSNVNNHFTMRLINGKCVWRISQANNLTPDQSKYLPVVKDRECLLQSGEFPEAVLFEIPELDFEHVTEGEVKRHMEKILSGLEYTPVAEESEIPSGEEGDGIPGAKQQKSQGRPNRMWNEAAKLLAEMGYISLSALYASLGNVSPWYGRKILKNMEGQGMIELCAISFGTRGNPKTFVVLKPKGAEFIGVDYDDVKLRGKGSTEHVILQNLFAEAMKDSRKNVTIEHHINGKSVDIAEIRENGSIAYEIELAPSNLHVVENVLKDLEAGFDEVVIITRNQTGQNEAKGQIYKNLPWEKLSRVKFKLLRDFL